MTKVFIIKDWTTCGIREADAVPSLTTYICGDIRRTGWMVGTTECHPDHVFFTLKSAQEAVLQSRARMMARLEEDIKHLQEEMDSRRNQIAEMQRIELAPKPYA